MTLRFVRNRRLFIAFRRRKSGRTAARSTVKDGAAKQATLNDMCLGDPTT
jgi:hypothetical protein